MSVPQSINHSNSVADIALLLDSNNFGLLGNIFFGQLLSNKNIMSIEYANEQNESIGYARNVFDLPLAMGVSGKATNFTYQLYEKDGENKTTKLSWELPKYDARTRLWYTQAASSTVPTWTPIYLFPNGVLGLDAIHPVEKDGKLVGVLDASLTLENISSLLRSRLPFKSSETFILERDGKLVAESNLRQPKFYDASEPERIMAGEYQVPEVQGAYRAILERYGDLNKIKEVKSFRFFLDKAPFVTTVSPFRDEYGLDWLVVTITPEYNFSMQSSIISRNILIIVILILLVVVLAIVGLHSILRKYQKSLSALGIPETKK